MGKIAIYLLLGIGIGAGIAYWQGAAVPGEALESGRAPAGGSLLERRLGELESALALERAERRALAAELDELRALIAADPEIGRAAPAPSEERAAGGRGERVAREAGEAPTRQRSPDGLAQLTSQQEREQYLQQRQFENYVAAGLAPDRARFVIDRQEALQWEVLEARYEASQNGATAAEVASLSVDSLLRRELGDADYEKYLAGSGRPTTVRVNEVLQNSPAQAVGLQAGDEIVAYNGSRVFNIGELNDLTNQLSPGQNVVLEIERDGQPLQFLVESGPIGISGGGRSARRGR